MGSEWEKASLGQIADIIDSRHKTPQYTDVGTPMVRVVDVKGGALNLAETKKVSPIDYSEYSKGRDPEVGDLIISRVGSYGNIAYVHDATNRFCLGQNTALIVPKIHWRYLYYQLISPDTKTQIEESVVGAVQKTISLKSIKSLDIPLPPLPEQKAIAHILGSLDDKIELNRRMNATLEGMAQALFKSWFVDFDPVLDNALAAGNPIPEELAERAEVRRKALADGTANREAAKQFPAAFQFTEEMGWIPEGWEVAALGEIAKFRNGRKSPDRIDGDIPVFGSNGLIGECAEYNREDVIIIGRVGTYCGSLQYYKSKCWATDNAMTGEMHDKVDNIYLFYLLELADLNSRRGGSGQPLLNQSILNSIVAARPSTNLMYRYSRQSQDMYAKIFFNNTTTTTLTKLRDTLLPKLISGELRIPETEKLTEEAMV